MSGLVEPRPYTPDNFVLTLEYGDVQGLRISLGVESVYDAILPSVVVGPDPGPKDTIFYLNVSPDNDPKLMRAAAESLAEIIVANKTVAAVITPQSHKSIPCMAEAVKIANEKSNRDIEFIVLLGGKQIESVSEGSPEHKVHYVPITTPEGKWASITEKDKIRLLSAAPFPEQVLLLDDVYSRGGTVDGVFALVNGIYHRPKDDKFSVAVIAVEQPITELDSQKIPQYMQTIMIIPEIPGQSTNI